MFQLVLVKGWGITVVEQGLKNPPQHEILSSNCVQSRLVLNTNNPIRLSFLQNTFPSIHKRNNTNVYYIPGGLKEHVYVSKYEYHILYESNIEEIMRL